MKVKCKRKWHCLLSVWG